MSTIVVGCRCGAQFAAEPQLAGQTVPCPRCGVARAVHEALLREMARSSLLRPFPLHHLGFGSSSLSPDGERVLPQRPAKVAAPR